MNKFFSNGRKALRNLIAVRNGCFCMPNLPDGASEDDTERDGLLSYAAEWHAFTIGVYNGMKSWRVRPKTLPANADVQSEPHYYKGGYAIGTVLQAAIVISAAAIATGNLPF